MVQQERSKGYARLAQSKAKQAEHAPVLHCSSYNRFPFTGNHYRYPSKMKRISKMITIFIAGSFLPHHHKYSSNAFLHCLSADLKITIPALVCF